MQPFSISMRVYYEDTDAGGIVYHANYLKFTERARTDWLRSAGLRQQELLEQGRGFVVTRLRARFVHSARLDDTLTVTCAPIRVGWASLTFYQQVLGEGQELLFEQECQAAQLDLRQRRPLPLSEELLELARAQLDTSAQQGVEY